jgi:hypothetical protein
VPLVLALVAIVLMLPTLPTGLFADDLIQRLAQFRPAELPPRILDTGFVPSDSGELFSVMANLFGFLRRPEEATRAREYGFVPWWAPEDEQAALFRPITAFTHWLDYRLFPNTPALMHAHNIVWYGLVVFLAATLYRKIGTSTRSEGLAGHAPEVPSGLNAHTAVYVAAVAACLFLLDKNTYFPVMFVANRGFFISLAFGLLCLHAHHSWRTTKSQRSMLRSALFLLLSLFSNEGGASTLAFLIAYALVLEQGAWRARLSSLLPAAIVLLAWRTVYMGLGFGVKHFLLYVDPGYAPLLFLKNLAPRANGVLGGQLTGVPPEVALALNAQAQTILAVFFAGFSLICTLVFLPLLWRDRVARFWVAVMLLAIVPAATVYPLTKNLAFVAVGAFGVIASFLVHLADSDERAAMPKPIRAIAWCLALWIVIAHVPGALAARVGLALVTQSLPEKAAHACAFEHSPEIGERDVIVVNDPTIVAAMVPFDRAYRHQPLPRTIRILVPGSVRFEVRRPDTSTLILTARDADLFDCPALGPIHISYVCKAANDLLFGGRTWKPSERVLRKGFVAEVLEVSPGGAPRSVAFHFNKPLESEEMVWLFFDWRRFVHSPFVLPRIGEAVEIAGPDFKRATD